MSRTRNLVIPEGKVPVAAYQAIYHKITHRTEKISVERRRPYEFAFQDLEDLHRLLHQGIQQYRIEAQSEEIGFLFSNQESENYSSFERFKIANLGIRSGETLSLFYAFDFLTILPNEMENLPDIAQRYRVSITCETIKMDEDTLSSASYILYSQDRDRLKGRLFVEIEFADRMVANALQALVLDWLSSRERKVVDATKSTWIAWLILIMKNASAVLAVAVLFGGAILDPIGLDAPSVTATRYFLVILAIAFLAGVSGDWISDKFRSLAYLLVPTTELNFTAGDVAARKERAAAEQRAKRIVSIVGIGVILAGTVGIFSNWISLQIF